jgi:hypothetical protein
MKSGHEEEAIFNLSWVRNLDRNDPYVLDEVAAMRHQIALELSVTRGNSGNSVVSYVKGIWAEISAKGIRNRMAIGFCMMMVCELPSFRFRMSGTYIPYSSKTWWEQTPSITTLHLSSKQSVSCISQSAFRTI